MNLILYVYLYNFTNMKNLYIILLAIVIFSCKKDDDNGGGGTSDSTGTLRLMVQNRGLGLDGNATDLVLGTYDFKTPEGDTISVDHIKYFISNIVLIKSDGSEKTVSGQYFLKTQNSSNTSATSMLDIDGFDVGEYDSIRFAIGVDENCNTIEACTSGDLDPYSTDAEAMIWSWASGSGYKFVRFEGSFKGNNTSASGAVNNDFSFHVGGNSRYKEVTLGTADAIKIEEGKTTMVHLMAMTHQILTSPNSIDLEATSSQGTAGADNLAENYADGMFMLHHVGDPSTVE